MLSFFFWVSLFSGFYPLQFSFQSWSSLFGFCVLFIGSLSGCFYGAAFLFNWLTNRQNPVFPGSALLFFRRSYPFPGAVP